MMFVDCLKPSGALLISLLGLAQLLGAASAAPIDNESELGDFQQREQFEPEPEFAQATGERRFRRQLAQPQPQLPAQPANPLVKFLNDLSPAPQGPSLMNGADTLSNLFKSALGTGGQQQQQQQPASSAFQLPAQLSQLLPTPQAQTAQQQSMSPTSLLNGVALMTQLSELMRSSQDQAGKAQQSAQATGQQALQAAQGAQTGIQSALTELGTGLTRLATNNPNLVPDVRQLYQSVSSRLSSTAGSGSSLNGPIVPATNAEQLADNLAKVALQPQPNV